MQILRSAQEVRKAHKVAQERPMDEELAEIAFKIANHVDAKKPELGIYMNNLSDAAVEVLQHLGYVIKKDVISVGFGNSWDRISFVSWDDRLLPKKGK
jgi:hypothetical protein